MGFQCEHQPLGIVLSAHDGHGPPLVDRFEFNSYAKELGIQMGWKIRRIGSWEVSSRSSTDEVNKKLGEMLSGLPVWPLRIDFETSGPAKPCCKWQTGGSAPSSARSGGSTQSVAFKRQPLGMVFNNKAPVTIKGFQPVSYARECGVELGWVIRGIADVDVSHETNFDRILEYLSQGERPLPTVDAGLELVDTSSV